MGTTSAWRRLHPERANALSRARLELHFAAQLASAPGASLLPPERDEGHTTLAWSPVHDALLGRRLPMSRLRAGLRPHDLTLMVTLDADVLSEQPLAGRTHAQALRWLSDELARHGDGALSARIAPPPLELPEHPVARGERFTGAEGFALAAVGDWMADAHHLLESVRLAHAEAGEVCTWPRHFDMATLLVLDGDAVRSGGSRGASDTARGRTIRCGMSPGDGDGAPYFYVRPWPCPDPHDLPRLPTGSRWITEGWVGATMSGTALADDAHEQRVQIRSFLDDAIEACKTLLARRG